MTESALRPATAYGLFAGFGLFWGVWGAALPDLKERTGVDDGQLGTALLVLGGSALPAMLLTGRMIDRWGLRVAPALVAALGASGALGAAAEDRTGLTLLAVAVGATSGAADVGINAVAGAVQRATSRPVLSRAHATFSAGVVVGSLGTGGVQAVTGTARPAFLTVGAALVVLAAMSRPGGSRPRHDGRATLMAAPLVLLPVLAVGLVAALAYAVENAHQSWSAVFLTDIFAASPALAATAPAVFAAVAAATRYAAAPLTTVRPLLVVTAGGLVAAGGCALVAGAGSVVLALLGVVAAAAGTSILFPTLLGAAIARTDPGARGRVTAIVTGTAYLGFLASPAGVGYLADRDGLRTAMAAVALTAVVFTVLAAPLVALLNRRQ